MLGFIPVPAGWCHIRLFVGRPGTLHRSCNFNACCQILSDITNGIYPDTIDPTDTFFSPRNREYYFSGSAPIQGRVLSWLPVREKGINARLDYLRRIPPKNGNTVHLEEAFALLKNIWDILIAGQDRRAPGGPICIHLSTGKIGRFFALRPDYWELRPAAINKEIKWYVVQMQTFDVA